MIKSYKKYLRKNNCYEAPKYNESEYLKNFREKATEYFNNLTPEDPGYYSGQIVDYNSKVIDEVGNFFDNHSWEECLDFTIDRIIKGMKLTKTVDISYTEGNGTPEQFGFKNTALIYLSLDKLVNSYNISIGKGEKADGECGMLWVTKKLGYGKFVESILKIDIDISVKDNHLFFKAKAMSDCDYGFHNEFKDIAKDINEKLKIYKKKDFFKIDLTK